MPIIIRRSTCADPSLGIPPRHQSGMKSKKPVPWPRWDNPIVCTTSIAGDWNHTVSGTGQEIKIGFSPNHIVPVKAYHGLPLESGGVKPRIPRSAEHISLLTGPVPPFGYNVTIRQNLTKVLHIIPIHILRGIPGGKTSDRIDFKGLVNRGLGGGNFSAYWNDFSPQSRLRGQNVDWRLGQNNRLFNRSKLKKSLIKRISIKNRICLHIRDSTSIDPQLVKVSLVVSITRELTGSGDCSKSGHLCMKWNHRVIQKGRTTLQCSIQIQLQCFGRIPKSNNHMVPLIILHINTAWNFSQRSILTNPCLN